MDLEDVLGVTLKQHYLKLLRAYETILAGGEEELTRTVLFSPFIFRGTN